MLWSMRSNEIFARMSPEQALGFLEEMKEEAPEVAQIALATAATAFRLRPEFLKRQPRARQAEWMRRALGRTIGASMSEEVLATYFLEHRADLLGEWLDGLGIEHEEGRLVGEIPPCPDGAKLKKTVAAFRKGEDQDKRELLMNAFAAQSAIDWPGLEAVLAGEEPPAEATPSASATADKPTARSKKATTKKTTAKKTTRKKAATKKSAAKKTTAKKASPKKATAKKARRKSG